jgi:hypothetical protein
MQGLPDDTGAGRKAIDDAATAAANASTKTGDLSTSVDTYNGKTIPPKKIEVDNANALAGIADTDAALNGINGKGVVAHITVSASLLAVGISQGELDAIAQLPASAFGIPHAKGGPMDAGQPYWVGEKGPELVIPKVDGTVIPADVSAALAARPLDASAALGGGGGGMTNIINVAPVMGMSATATGQKIVDGMTREVRRQGGSLVTVPSRAF